MVSLLNLVLEICHNARLWLWRKWWITLLGPFETGHKSNLVLLDFLLYTQVMIFGRQVLKIESILNTLNSLWGFNRLRCLRVIIITTLVSSTLSLHKLIWHVGRFWYLKWCNSYGTRLITFGGILFYVFSTLMIKLRIILIFCNSLLRLLLHLTRLIWLLLSSATSNLLIFRADVVLEDLHLVLYVILVCIRDYIHVIFVKRAFVWISPARFWNGITTIFSLVALAIRGRTYLQKLTILISGRCNLDPVLHELHLIQLDVLKFNRFI